MTDTQNVELAGRNLLATSLQLAGVEVARPERDHGIDLIVYLDKDIFQAVPIQVKVSSEENFGAWPRYSEFPQLVLVFIWHVHDKPRFFALTQDDSIRIAETMGWTKTRSWKGEASVPKGYSTRSPSAELRALLDQHEVKSPADWKRVLFPGARYSIHAAGL